MPKSKSKRLKWLKWWKRNKRGDTPNAVPPPVMLDSSSSYDVPAGTPLADLWRNLDDMSFEGFDNLMPMALMQKLKEFYDRENEPLTIPENPTIPDVWRAWQKAPKVVIEDFANYLESEYKKMWGEEPTGTLNPQKFFVPGAYFELSIQMNTEYTQKVRVNINHTDENPTILRGFRPYQPDVRAANNLYQFTRSDTENAVQILLTREKKVVFKATTENPSTWKLAVQKPNGDILIANMEFMQGYAEKHKEELTTLYTLTYKGIINSDGEAFGEENITLTEHIPLTIPNVIRPPQQEHEAITPAFNRQNSSSHSHSMNFLDHFEDSIMPEDTHLISYHNGQTSFKFLENPLDENEIALTIHLMEGEKTDGSQEWSVTMEQKPSWEISQEPDKQLLEDVKKTYEHALYAVYQQCISNNEQATLNAYELPNEDGKIKTQRENIFYNILKELQKFHKEHHTNTPFPLAMERDGPRLDGHSRPSNTH